MSGAERRSFCFAPGADDRAFDDVDDFDGTRSTSLIITMSVGEAIAMARELLQAIEKGEQEGDAVQVKYLGEGSWVVYGDNPEDDGTPLFDPGEVPS